MIKYPEFEMCERLVDLVNRDAHCYQTHDKHIFYIEKSFYNTFEKLKILFPDRIQDILDQMYKKIENNKITIFTLDDEHYYVIKEGAIIVTLEDLCNLIHLDITNKSRGSDYGD